jgi:hypothetical protein
VTLGRPGFFSTDSMEHYWTCIKGVRAAIFSFCLVPVDRDECRLRDSENCARCGIRKAMGVVIVINPCMMSNLDS